MSNIDEYQITKDAEEAWRTSPVIRAEFPSVDAYRAFLIAKAKGHVRIRSNAADGGEQR